MQSKLVLSISFVIVVTNLARGLECPMAVESNPADLVQFLQTQARTADSECVTRAIRRLGGSRSTLGASVLVDLLDFRRPDSEAEKMRIFDMHDRFPAIPALFSVGSSAVPALLEKLKSGKASQIARSNGIRTLVLIHRDSPPEAIKILKKAASDAKNSEEAAQLESCARDAVAFCYEKSRAQCEDEAAK